MSDIPNTNSASSVVTHVTVGEPLIVHGPVETIDVPLPNPPKKKSAVPARPPHWLDVWVKDFNPEALQERLDAELKRRHLLSAKDFEQNPMKVVAALQRVLQLDASKIIALSRLMEDSENG